MLGRQDRFINRQLNAQLVEARAKRCNIFILGDRRVPSLNVTHYVTFEKTIKSMKGLMLPKDDMRVDKRIHNVHRRQNLTGKIPEISKIVVSGTVV